MSENTTELVAGAVTAFSNAVHALIGLRPDTIERDDFTTEPIVLDSLYTELMEARFGERAGTGVRRPTPGSRAPGWTEAISLLDQIDRTVTRWWPTLTTTYPGRPITVQRLYTLVDWPWSPHELADLKRYTRQVEVWVQRANTLLTADAGHTYELRAACPSCGETTVQVDDGSGETVRQYVLQADQSSARCVACETSWSPDSYRLLAAMIGAEMPEGVLE
ncbi:DUF7341 domain-containing protein [Nocardia niwae]|uniref:DUF7341 domain-containing protein n=1 Tax=Nocardia niwae TaxID=626084 RepID=UPI0007A49AF4|nr:hypothetical protein [Nocardia niwae]